MAPKKRIKSINLIFGSAGCSFLGVEGFSCSMDALKGGLGISRLKNIVFFQLYFFSSIFGHQNIGPGSGSGCYTSFVAFIFAFGAALTEFTTPNLGIFEISQILRLVKPVL
jgi:hypothetical protein